MNNKNLLLIAASLLIINTSATAQEAEGSTKTSGHSIKISSNKLCPIGKGYWGGNLDGMIFSTAFIDRIGTKSLGTLRFTAWFHIGATYNYNINKNVGIFTGLDLKNIGFIEKFKVNDLTTKQRVYTLGVPVGLRLGNMQKRNYLFLGGGLDLALQYKSKYWDVNTKKTKTNDWFSDKTNLLMPYVFVGAAIGGTTIKIQYYPTNFYNEDYSISGIKPYANNKVNLLLFSVGKDINLSKK